AVHPPLKRVFNAPCKAFIRHLSRLLPSTQRSPNGSFLTPPAAAATVARDSATPRAATTHGRSTQPPSRAYTAATESREMLGIMGFQALLADNVTCAIICR